MQLPPPPDIFPLLSEFRQRLLYCDVCLKFNQSPLSKIFAHRIVLSAFSSFFADLCQDDISGKGSIREILLPPSVKYETMQLVLRWMYNEGLKTEHMVEDKEE